MYSFWIVLAVIAFIMTILALGRIISDWQKTDITDVMLCIFGFFTSIVCGLSAVNLEFVSSTGVINYQGMWWLLYPFFAMGLLDFGFVFITVISIMNQIKEKRGY